MPPVFGRHIPDPHPYDKAIAAWLGMSSSYRAMARNVMHDHRVTVLREQRFGTFCSSPCTYTSLESGIIDYFNSAVRTRRLPDYVFDSLNGINILSGTPTGRHLVHKDLELVRLVDLNGLRVVFAWAKDRGLNGFASFPIVTTDDKVKDWLNYQILGRPSNQVERFVECVLRAMNEHRIEHPFQPTWATAWSAFLPHEMAGPDRWAQALGLCKVDYPRWFVLLRYRVREAGTLVRPTQLDAGWGVYHFPSPPQEGANCWREITISF